MPVLEDESVEVVEGEATSADLKLFESVVRTDRDAEAAVELVESFVEDDDRRERLAESVRRGNALVLDLIRPCVGRGKGNHLYRASMLEANAHKFTGWKMYLNHLSDAARRALGGLPRDIRDTGGIVQETWWNPDVPASGRFGKGAVQAVVSPVPLIQELHRVDPRLVESSINATATKCTPGKVNGEHVWIVEGIEEKGSVDWVTEAGAGGRVAQIMEAMIEDGSAVTGALDTLDNGTIMAWISEHRPELAEALRSKKPAEGSPEEEADESAAEELEEQIQKLLKSNKGMSRAQATALAKQALKRKNSGGSAGGSDVSEAKGDGVADITPEVLAEALASDEAKAAIQEAIAPAVVEAVRELNLGSEVVSLVESKLDLDREVIRAEAEARADRRNALRDMRDLAHRKIEESRLHPILKDQVKARFDLREGTPTSELDLVADEDEDGTVVKTAQAKITEAVDAALSEQFKVMAALNPTRVRGQGPAASIAEGDEGKDEKPDRVGGKTRSLLEGLGIKDPDKAYERELGVA